MQNDLETLNKEIDTLKKENEMLKREIVSIKDKEELREKGYNQSSRESDLLIQIETWKDVLYKLAHSINNDLYNAGHILSQKANDAEMTNAFYHINRIDDLVKLNLWLLKKNELPENWKQLDLGKEIYELINSTKRGITTLRVSENHSQKLVAVDISPTIIGDVKILLERDRLDTIISLIIQDLIRNAFKYSDENDPLISISLDGNLEDSVTIIFTNNKKMDEKFIRYLNIGDVEPNISDSSKVGLRSILEWVKLLHLNIKSWNSDEANECSIRIIIPRSVTYEND